MKVLIVGAGLAGLSTAIALAHSETPHEILLLEAAPRLAEVGAGVQLTAVATRQFTRWGLGPSLLEAAAIPESWILRRGSDGSILNRVPMKELEKTYGGPYIVVHRADLHRILHEHAVSKGVQIKLNSRIIEYGVEDSWVLLENGDKLEADLVVACDGVNSTARAQLLKRLGVDETEAIEPTGWAAYRTMVDVEDVKADPLTAEIVAEHNGNCWADADKSLMSYMVRGSGKLNLVFSHPDDIDTSSWRQEQLLEELKLLSSDMDPRARRIIDLVKTPITNWPVYAVRTLPTWTSSSGRFVLIGDAAHAMAFYLSMGVSMAVEDAAALVATLDLHTASASTVSLSAAMSLFERVRKPRADAVRDASLHAGAMLHLPPGAERDARDEAARSDGVQEEALKKGDCLLDWTSFGITDQTIRGVCYGYDVVEDVRSQAIKEGLST
ncbi:salicylate hydroxylase [Byssothecium circinans]|uniref:Salicylate hydroxylase n=1 Tax=Byssothecium circinans TaxID=147558 RepID=A0A6A5UAX4_9PLEO|nr:salicylate hydroxylase [Byssothecium circinans]